VRCSCGKYVVTAQRMAAISSAICGASSRSRPLFGVFGYAGLASQVRLLVLALLRFVGHHAERIVGVLDQQGDPSEQHDEEDEGRSIR
jgi:hypothetical protein